MDSNQLYKTLRSTVDKIRIFDTHEHLIQEKERTSKKLDLFETILAQYASSDLTSSGMPKEDLDIVRDQIIPLEKRWEIFKIYWERIQNTGYARALNIAFKHLYSIDALNDETYFKLASRMQEANKPGLYKWIIKEKSGIDISILDNPTYPLEDVDRDFFAPVKRFDDFVMVSGRTELEHLGRRNGKSIHSLSDLVESLEVEFKKYSKMIVGVKIGLAYLRKLHFEKVSEREAEEVFVNIYNMETFRRKILDEKEKEMSDWLSFVETKPLQDFMVHKIIQLASKNGLPIQIHTGIQEGNENIITNSKPTDLINLFREYKEARFDIFHGSYPYVGELAVLAKNFPNVYIDMCWLHIISPNGARQALTEWLDTVPWNKIFGFGGDYTFAEGVFGHSIIARENIAKVLTDKVEEGSFSKKQALILAQKLLRDNASNFFCLKMHD